MDIYNSQFLLPIVYSRMYAHTRCHHVCRQWTQMFAEATT